MLNPVEINTLKAAQKRLVARNGGQEACVLVPGMRLRRHQSFNDFGNPDLPDRHMTVDVVAALERFAGIEVTRTLADLNGCLLVPLPVGALNGALAEGTGRTVKEVGDVMVRIGEALRDGRVDDRERTAILTEIHEAMLSLAALAEAVRAESDKGEDPDA